MSRELCAVVAVLLAMQAGALWIARGGPGAPTVLALGRQAVTEGYAPYLLGAAFGLLALVALLRWGAGRARRKPKTSWRQRTER